MWRYLIAAAVVGVASPAAAQFEGYLSSVTDVHVYLSCWDGSESVERETSCPSRNGFGIEVLWDLGAIPLLSGGTTKAPTRKVATVEYRFRDSVINLPGGRDSVATRVDSVITYSQAPGQQILDHPLRFELALGWSQFAGFGSLDPRFELRGTVRELPSLALYATYEGGDVPLLEALPFSVDPYVGLRTGIIELRNAQAFVPATDSSAVSFPASAQAFQLGLGGGFAIRVGGKMHLTIEGAYHVRRFPSIQWSGNPVHDFLPRSIDFSGFSYSLGAQFRLRDPK